MVVRRFILFLSCTQINSFVYADSSYFCYVRKLIHFRTQIHLFCTQINTLPFHFHVGPGAQDSRGGIEASNLGLQFTNV